MNDYVHNLAMGYYFHPTAEGRQEIFQVLNDCQYSPRQRAWVLNALRKWGHDQRIGRCLFCGQWFPTLIEVPVHFSRNHGRSL